MGDSVSVQVRYTRLGNLGASWLRTSQVVDGQQTDERQPFSFDLTPSILFLPIYDHQGMSDDQAGSPGSRDGFEKRPPACEHIIDNHSSIPWLERSFDEFPEPMILRLLPHHEGAPRSRQLSRKGKIRDAGGNGNRPNFQSAEAIEFDRPQRVIRQVGYKAARARMGHQRPAIDVKWTPQARSEREPCDGVPLE